MANVLRIIRNAMARKVGYMLIAALAAFLTSQCAHAADVPASYKWHYKSVDYMEGSAWCQFRIQEMNQQAGSSGSSYNYISTALSDSGPNSGPRATCTFDSLYNGAFQQRRSDEYIDSAYYCPSGDQPRYTPSGYVCNAPPPPNCNEGETVQSGLATVPVTPQVGCVSSCEVLWNPSGPSAIDCDLDSGGIGVCYYKQPGAYKKTGASCSTPSPLASTPPPKGPCPVCDCLKQGKSYGTVNGAIVCVTAGTPGAAPVKNTPPPTTSSGSTTTNNSTTNNTTNNSTSSTVFNSDGTATTTTSSTSTPPGGTPTTTSTTETKPVADYCKDNPKTPQCKVADEGSFGGSCDAGWTCEGDAAMCALAKRVHVSRCEDTKKNDTTLRGEAAMAGTDESPDDPRLASNTKVIEVGDFNTSSGSLPDGGCISDKSVAIMGRSITIPLSELCPYLNMLGNGLLALAWLTAAMIVTGNRGGKA